MRRLKSQTRTLILTLRLTSPTLLKRMKKPMKKSSYTAKERSIWRRRILDAELESSGYRQGKRKGDKVVYRPETVWHPSVVVHDSGWVDLKKNPSSLRTLDWRTPRQQVAVLVLYSTLRVDVYSCFRLADYAKGGLNTQRRQWWTTILKPFSIGKRVLSVWQHNSVFEVQLPG